jgi:2-aminoethylphosphonate transport system permease protein
MLVWSSRTRRVVHALTALAVGVLYLLPLAVIGAASVAGEWNGLLPTRLTPLHYAHAFSGELAHQIAASLLSGLLASATALVSGSWAALALRDVGAARRRWLDLLFFVPSAVPSVSVGLGLLVAFSQPPLLLNGTVAIVVLAHFAIVSAFSYGNVAAGLKSLPAELEQVARSLGAEPAYCLRHVTLPLLAPQLAAAFSLSLALSMGELGATVMVYPPGWATMPVGIFALADRGAIFDASALSIVLVLLTWLALLAVSWLGRRRR